MADYTVTEEDFATALDSTALDEEIKTIIDDYFEDVGNDVVIETIDPTTGDIIDVTTEVVYVNASVTESGNVQITIADITFFVDASSSLAALFLNDGSFKTTAGGTDTTKVIIGTSLDDSITISKTAANIDVGAGDDTVTTGSGADVITAGMGDDSISSGAGNDSVKVNNAEAGNDTVNTGSGYDEVIVNEAAANFDTVISASGELTLTSKADGFTKTITNAEFISFQKADGTVSSVVVNTHSEIESSVARMYEAFGRQADKDGMEYWSNEVSSGNTDLTHLAGSFLNTAEGQSLYASDMGNPLFVSTVYAKVLNRELDDTSQNWWVKQMNEGMTKAEVMARIVNSDEAREEYNYINNLGDDLV